MQCFQRRRITLKTMQESDVAEYYGQFNSMDEEERSKKIKSTKRSLRQKRDNVLVLAVRAADENERIIGAIFVEYFNKKIIGDHISIPNELKELSYGVELIDQFIKICQEEKFFESVKFVKLDNDDINVKKYKEGKKITSSYISVA